MRDHVRICGSPGRATDRGDPAPIFLLRFIQSYSPIIFTSTRLGRRPSNSP